MSAPFCSRSNCFETNSNCYFICKYLSTCIPRRQRFKAFFLKAEFLGMAWVWFPPLGGQVLLAWFGPVQTFHAFCCLLWAMLLSAPSLAVDSSPPNSLKALDGAGPMSCSPCPPSQGIPHMVDPLGLWYTCHSPASAPRAKPQGRTECVMLYSPHPRPAPQGSGGGCSALPPCTGRSDVGHWLWPQGHPAQLPGGGGR